MVKRVERSDLLLNGAPLITPCTCRLLTPPPGWQSTSNALTHNAIRVPTSLMLVSPSAGNRDAWKATSNALKNRSSPFDFSVAGNTASMLSTVVRVAADPRRTKNLPDCRKQRPLVGGGCHRPFP